MDRTVEWLRRIVRCTSGAPGTALARPGGGGGSTDHTGRIRPSCGPRSAGCSRERKVTKGQVTVKAQATMRKAPPAMVITATGAVPIGTTSVPRGDEYQTWG